MFLTEYDEALHERTCREAGWEEGWKEGREKGQVEGRTEGITGTISVLRKLGHDEDDIRKMLGDEYGLTEGETEGFLRQTNLFPECED